MTLALVATLSLALAGTPANVHEIGPLKIVIGGAPLTLKHEGALKEVLEKIAEKGGLNVVIVGDLNEPARLHLTSVTAEEALESVAKIYGLDVQREGKMWVVRKKASAPQAVVLASPAPEVQSLKERAREIKADAREQALALKEEARELAADLKAEAKSIKEDALEEAEAAREEAQAAREEAEELKAAAEEEAEEARAHAEEIRARVEKAHAFNVRGGADRVAAGGSLVVEAGTTVDTAVAYGGNVVVEEGAHVNDDAVAFGGNVILKDGVTVGGDAVAFGGNVQKADSATVHGELVSFGGREMGASIARGAMKARSHSSRDEDGFGSTVAGFLLQFALLFGLGFLAMMFMPNRMKQLESAVRQQPVRNGLVGMLALVALVPLTILLTVTLVGIPVVVVMYMALFILAPLGLVAVANTVGVTLPTGRLHKTQALVLALGLLTMLLVARIPVAGPIALSVAGLVSLGAIVRTRFGSPPKGVPLPDSSGDSLPTI